MVTIDFKNDKAVCPKCKGQLMYDATVTQKLPLGFGFVPHGTKFQIDYIIQKGFRGQCIECQTEVFAVKSRRTATRFPQTINRKLKLSA